MGLYSCNHGMVSPLKGCIITAFRITIGATGAVASVDDEGKSNFVSGVTRNSSGIYTVQLNQPYPASMVICIPQLDVVDEDGEVVEASYQHDSYDASAGTFIINTQADEDNVTPADPTEGTSVHVFLIMQRLTNL